jgi:hypothetical protein
MMVGVYLVEFGGRTEIVEIFKYSKKYIKVHIALDLDIPLEGSTCSNV